MSDEHLSDPWGAGPPTGSPIESPMPPIVASPPSFSDRRPPPGARTRWTVVAGAVAALALVFTSVQWSSAAARSERLQRQVDHFEADAARRRADQAARPDLRKVADGIEADDSDVSFEGDARSLEVVSTGYDLAWLGALLDELGFDEAVVKRMGQTRALDGTLDASAPHVSVTWTYHPDDGLQAVFSVEE